MRVRTGSRSRLTVYFEGRCAVLLHWTLGCTGRCDDVLGRSTAQRAWGACWPNVSSRQYLARSFGKFFSSCSGTRRPFHCSSSLLSLLCLFPFQFTGLRGDVSISSCFAFRIAVTLATIAAYVPVRLFSAIASAGSLLWSKRSGGSC